jgi:hypothetical protein
MTSQPQATITRPGTDTTPARKPGKARYLLAAVIAILGVVGGLAYGLNSYQDSQRQLDNLARVSIPGTLTVTISHPTGRVLYYEGSDSTNLADLAITVTDPTGSDVSTSRYEGDLVYETLDLTTGRAVPTFDAKAPGQYTIAVTGADTGQLTVGGNYAHQALPGVITGLGIAAVSIAAGFLTWLLTYINRHRTVSRNEPS